MKKFILHLFFPFLKLKNNQPLSKRFFIYIDIIITAYIYIALIIYFSSFLFYPYKIQMNNITYYSFEDITKNKTFLNTIKNVNQKNINNALYDKELKIEVYFINNEAIYKFHNPLEILPNKNTYTITLGSKIIFKMVDFEKSLVYSNQNKKFPYELERALLHEVTHSLQFKKYGFYKFYTNIPYWVSEGYPIYSSGKSSIYNENEFLSDLSKKDFDTLTTYQKDFFFSKIVEFAIEDMNISVDDLHKNNIDFSTLKNKFLDKSLSLKVNK